MDEVKTSNHLPEKPKERLHQKVMEMDKYTEEQLKAGWRAIFERQTLSETESEKRTTIHSDKEYHHSQICVFIGFIIGLAVAMAEKLLFQ